MEGGDWSPGLIKLRHRRHHPPRRPAQPPAVPRPPPALRSTTTSPPATPTHHQKQPHKNYHKIFQISNPTIINLHFRHHGAPPLNNRITTTPAASNAQSHTDHLATNPHLRATTDKKSGLLCWLLVVCLELFRSPFSFFGLDFLDLHFASRF
ncbi:hypothetical protein RND81_02G198600 [Saponaria officinalis]|uniref:Uncharacterized protein n=1 Tax=Saponaria officinalis TaxID=3572 RepID=A0AAW1MYA9_SAPOF